MTTVNKKIARSFDSWHFAMMNDDTRNKSLEYCFRTMSLADKTVLEIGTGAGLTAIQMAKAGASHIYTCEINLQLFEVAKTVIAQSPYANKITIFDKHSSEIFLKEQPRFDVIFSETLDCGVIGEGFYTVANDIRRLANENTTIIPNKVQQFEYLVESKDLHQLNCCLSSSEPALEAINSFSTETYFPVRTRNFEILPLSDPVLIKEYCYLDDQPKKHVSQKVNSNRSSCCHGLISFFNAHFGRSIISNTSLSTAGHWHQAYHPLKTPRNLTAGESYQISINFNGKVEANNA